MWQGRRFHCFAFQVNTAQAKKLPPQIMPRSSARLRLVSMHSSSHVAHIYPNKKSKAASDAIQTPRRIFRIIWVS